VLALRGGDAAAGAAALVVMLTLVAAIAFVMLKTGVSSSNHGTFYRESDGWRYWRDVLVLLAVYALFCVAPHIAVTKQRSSAAVGAATKPAVIDRQAMRGD
jgi:membrane-associated PAP2 superfamily phosphatase